MGYKIKNEEGIKDIGRYFESLLKTFLTIEKEMIHTGLEPIGNEIVGIMNEIKKMSGYKGEWLSFSDFGDPNLRIH